MKFAFTNDGVSVGPQAVGAWPEAGTRHDVINTSQTTPLKVYTIYSLPNHADGTVHKTEAEAETAERAKHHSRVSRLGGRIRERMKNVYRVGWVLKFAGDGAGAEADLRHDAPPRAE